MNKYNLGETIYFIDSNSIYEGIITSISISYKDWERHVSKGKKPPIEIRYGVEFCDTCKIMATGLKEDFLFLDVRSLLEHLGRNIIKMKRPEKTPEEIIDNER